MEVSKESHYAHNHILHCDVWTQISTLVKSITKARLTPPPHHKQSIIAHFPVLTDILELALTLATKSFSFSAACLCSLWKFVSAVVNSPTSRSFCIFFWRYGRSFTKSNEIRLFKTHHFQTTQYWGIHYFILFYFPNRYNRILPTKPLAWTNLPFPLGLHNWHNFRDLNRKPMYLVHLTAENMKWAGHIQGTTHWYRETWLVNLLCG